MPSPFPPSLLYKFANLPLHLTLIKLIKLVFPFSWRKRKTKLETLISLSPPMASTTTASYAYTSQNSSSQRSVAMVLVLVSAIVLSPLYANPRKAVRQNTMRQNGALMGLFFPWFLLDLSLPLKPLLHLHRVHHLHRRWLEEILWFLLLSLRGCWELGAHVGALVGFWWYWCLCILGKVVFMNSCGDRKQKIEIHLYLLL